VTRKLQKPSRQAVKLARRKPEDPSGRMKQHYQELRGMARGVRRQRADQTLQTTDLVHEAYVRLAEHGPEKYANRAHFFGSAKRAMRATLVDRARKRRAKKRGGDWQKVPLEDVHSDGAPVRDFHALHEVLNRLNAFDPRLCRIVELRFFDGLSTAEIAVAVKRGNSTIRRDWTIAKAWLQRELAGHCG
jgi:RNA polymerase sigma factor (TIGR02999 family)